jgi:putative transposase
MARPLRIEGEDCVYHLTARGDRRQKIFRDDTDCVRFRDRMIESIGRYNVELHAWVLMGNHVHLLARTREANLSRWMQWLLGVHAMDFNRRYRLCGRVFQGRFKSFLVEERGYFAELGRYIHLNPVRGAALGKKELKVEGAAGAAEGVGMEQLWSLCRAGGLAAVAASRRGVRGVGSGAGKRSMRSLPAARRERVVGRSPGSPGNG